MPSQAGARQRRSNNLFIAPDRTPLLPRLPRGRTQRASSVAAATWKPSKSPVLPSACAIKLQGAVSRPRGPNDVPGRETPWAPSPGSRPAGPAAKVREWRPAPRWQESPHLSAGPKPGRGGAGRGGASRVPFKRPHHPALTSGCLSVRRSPRPAPPAPQRPQPRRPHDWRRPRERAARLGLPALLPRLLLCAPAAARARASSSIMSVAGLKKQFHKATQVRRETGAPRGGPGRSCQGRAGSLRSAGSSASPVRATRGGICELGARPPVSTPGSVRLSQRQWVPGVPPRRPAPAPAPPGAGAPGRGPRPRLAGARAARREIM